GKGLVVVEGVGQEVGIEEDAAEHGAVAQQNAKPSRVELRKLPHGAPIPGMFGRRARGESDFSLLQLCPRQEAKLCPVAMVVGAPGFEPGTPSPPDWCANRAALRSARVISTMGFSRVQGLTIASSLRPLLIFPPALNFDDQGLTSIRTGFRS